MRLLFAAICAGVFGFFCTSTPATASTAIPTPTQVSAERKPYEADGFGGFSYAVPIALPAYRGLEPALRLHYDSSNTSRGSEGDILGIGWSLSGLSLIERVSQGQGVPTFRDSDDIYLLDGQMLLACDDAAATNKWTDAYPARFKTDAASSSCRAGGNFSTIREGDRKIVRDAVANTWTVYDADGTRYIYKSKGALANHAATNDTEEKLLTKSVWLLAEIRNAQSTESVVRIQYRFNSGQGWPARPKYIDYAGYRTEFGYVVRTGPMSTWATGTAIAATQKNRLVSIRVTHGSSGIAAYSLSYGESPETKSALLTKVEQFGKDFVLTGQEITGGAKLPNPYVFTYNTDALSFETKTYTGQQFSSQATVWDYDRNGTDELLFRTVIERADGCEDTYRSYTIDKSFHKIDANRTLSPLSIPSSLSDYFNAPGASNRGFNSVGGVARFDPAMGTDGQQVFIGRRITDYKNSDADYFFTGYWDTYGVSPSTGKLSELRYLSYQLSRDKVANVPLSLSNFDTDPASEFQVDEKIYDLVDGEIVYRKKASRKIGLMLDIDGDSMDEYLSENYTHFDEWALYDPEFTTTPNFRRRDIPQVGKSLRGGFLSMPQLGRDLAIDSAGDVNGDGKDDMVIHRIRKYNDTDQIHVALSTGERFQATQQWIGGSAIPKVSFGGDNDITPSLSIRDLNGDGIGDLIYYRGIKRPRLNCDSFWFNNHKDKAFWRGTAYVFISDGKSFKAPVDASARTIPHFVTVGDFNGDGRADMVQEGWDGKIHFGTGAPANTMKTVDDPLGATTTITYAPKSVVGSGDAAPGARQMVQKIVRDNGRGDTRTVTYGYNDETYDYELRRSLGFRVVTSYLPKIAGEPEKPRVVKIYDNATFGAQGTLLSKTMIVGNQTWKREYYGYSMRVDGNGPYVVRRKSERKATNQDGTLIETLSEFWYDDFGQMLRMIDFGRSEDGADVAIQDNLTTIWNYAANTEDFIVGLPYRILRQTASTGIGDLATLLSGEWRYFDGNPYASDPPVQGNVTSVRQWNGNRTSWGRRTAWTYTYDLRGNLLTETNLAGDVTRHVYGGPEKLFRTKTTDAAGGVTTATWDALCGRPSEERDANNLATTHTTDTFCRPDRTTYPDGQFRQLTYHHLGKGDQQYTQVTSRSGSRVAGSELRMEREYFDGFGQVYKRAKTGTTSDEADMIVTVSSFDARGNLETESMPLTWANTLDNTAAPENRTAFTYDTLGRKTGITHPDGARVEVSHRSGVRAHHDRPSMQLQYVETKDERCFDDDAATICGQVRDYFDTSGNLVERREWDRDGTDVGWSAGWRSTRYDFDLLGRLVEVRDPMGKTWSYTYDSYGNRTVADDPGLGRWTMTYNNVNRLTEQRDAKNQRIRFTYDALGRVTRKDVLKSDGSLESSITSTYGEPRSGFYNAGRLTRVVKDGHEVRYGYRANGQIGVEDHTIDGRRYEIVSSYFVGHLEDQKLPFQPGSTANRWEGKFAFDAAGRTVGYNWKIPSITYNLRGQVKEITYPNGVKDTRAYTYRRGWLNSTRVTDGAGGVITRTIYTRTADGRVSTIDTNEGKGRYDFAYDYAGRLLQADNPIAGNEARDQSFTYDASGRMRSNSHVGTYDYSADTPGHAPWRVRGDTTTTLSYDANGNMLLGIDGKAMTYDAENRPTQVTKGGTTTRYEYGADGKRLKKIEIAPEGTEVTVYFGPVEIRDYGSGANETIITYPHPNVRLTNGTFSALHKDQLNSVRAITDWAGEVDKRSYYKPFGEVTETTYDAAAAAETKGFIGERFDAGAGLQFLNARYYDPKLGLFLQPDWFEVTDPQVGTNRYAYSFNDPVNLADPNGNFIPLAVWGAVAAYKAVSTAIAVMDAADTIEALASGEMTVGEAATQVATDVVVGATIGRAGAKVVEGAVKRVRRGAPDGSAPADCSCGCSSFHADTPVVMQTGTKPIADIEVGDIVLAADPVTGAPRYERVTAVHVSDYDETYHITFRGDDGEVTEILSSFNHPFFAVLEPGEPRLMTVSTYGITYEGPIEGGTWLDARDLTPGTMLREADGSLLEVVGVDMRRVPLTAHNLTVEGAETYFVGDADDAVWVHNCGDDGAIYNRARDYGTNTTRSAKAKQARAEGEGQDCPECGTKMVSGTESAPSPQHDPPLVEHFYDHGGSSWTKAQRKAYAENDGIDGAVCRKCQQREGAAASRYSRKKKDEIEKKREENKDDDKD